MQPIFKKKWAVLLLQQWFCLEHICWILKPVSDYCLHLTQVLRQDSYWEEKFANKDIWDGHLR